MDQATLAEKSGVSVETIKRLEGLDGPLKAQLFTLDNIRRTLEYAGLEFIDDDKRPGVRVAEDRTKAFLNHVTEHVADSFRANLEIKLRKDPSIVQGSKMELIKEVLESVEDILKYTLPRRLPGKDDW